MDEELGTCYACKKNISDNEWVVNWGYCADCLNKSFDAYTLSQSDIPLTVD